MSLHRMIPIRRMLISAKMLYRWKSYINFNLSRDVKELETYTIKTFTGQLCTELHAPTRTGAFKNGVNSDNLQLHAKVRNPRSTLLYYKQPKSENAECL